MVIEGAEYYGHMKHVDVKDIITKLEKEFGKITITGNDYKKKILTFRKYVNKTVDVY